MALILVFYFIFSGFDILSAGIFPIAVVSLIAILDIVREPVNQQIYKEEKMSAIMPYLNLSKIMVIISSFFIYQDVSNITFCITLLTVVIIALASIDIKHKRFPKSFSKILFVETLRAIGALLGGWLVLSYSEIMYFNVYALAYLIPTIFLAYYSNQLGDFKKTNITFWFYRLIAGAGWFSWFLSLLVIKNLGLSLSILLGFLGIGVTLLISYIFL